MSVPLLHKAKSNDETPILNPRPTIHQLALSIIEACSILNLVFPMVLTGLLLYTRSMISMFFLGRLGSLPRRRLLAIGFANITGYPFSPGLPPAWSPSVVRPTAPAVQIISVSPSAAQFYFSSLLLSPSPYSGSTCAVFSFFCNQDPAIAEAAQSFILFSIPDLLLQSFLHPLRIYFRTQSIVLPLSATAAATAALHFPHQLLSGLLPRLGIPGVAPRLRFHQLKSRPPPCPLSLLLWWWYEIMVLPCGLLLHPQFTVASMGIPIQTTSLIYIFPPPSAPASPRALATSSAPTSPNEHAEQRFVGLACGTLLGLIAFSFSFSVRNVWAKIFTVDAEIVSLTAAVCFPFWASASSATAHRRQGAVSCEAVLARVLAPTLTWGHSMAWNARCPGACVLG
ncbi:hypothetical protein HPP92_022151 [Vanilla planifolia]|uniref:Uncharacterized protein n=1 Tax=Vanilla planifolia TaxID=51239 RepID=A0A835PP45_VANPL|nr:hypothetical protein HPP92_022151 [Vanilla planifolia]